MRITPKKLHRLCRAMGIDHDRLVGKAREEGLVDARQALSIYLYRNGLSYQKIGDLLNRDHSSIHNLVNTRMITTRALKMLNTILIVDIREKDDNEDSTTTAVLDDRSSYSRDYVH